MGHHGEHDSESSHSAEGSNADSGRGPSEEGEAGHRIHHDIHTGQSNGQLWTLADRNKLPPHRVYTIRLISNPSSQSATLVSGTRDIMAVSRKYKNNKLMSQKCDLFSDIRDKH